MINFLQQVRKQMVLQLQNTLRELRKQLGLSASDIAYMLSVTRQTIHNIETKKITMTAPQYLSIIALIEHQLIKNPSKTEHIISLITKRGYTRPFSLLEHWFDSFIDSATIWHTINACDKNEEASSIWQHLTSHYKLFIMEESFLLPHINRFLHNYHAYSDEPPSLIMSVRSAEALVKMLEQEDLAPSALYALKIIHLLQEKNTLLVRGESNDPLNSKEVILQVFKQHQEAYQLCLITQNHSFAQEVALLNQQSNKRSILIGAIDEEGSFTSYYTDTILENSLTSNNLTGWREL